MLIRSPLIDIVRSTELDDVKIKQIKEQLKLGASFEEKNKDGASIFHEACYNGGVNLLKWLLKKFPKFIFAKTKNGTNVYCYAAQYNNLAAMQFILSLKEASKLANETNVHSFTHFAALSGNIQIFELAKSKFYGNTFNTENHQVMLTNILLHLGCKGHIEMVKHLIENYGANPHGLTDEGDSMIHFAAIHGQLSTVKLLKEKYQADCNRFNKRGAAPIHGAAAGGRNEVICYLIDECKVNVEIPVQNENGNSPLQIAASYGQLSTVKLLKEKYQADCNRFNKMGAAPIHAAAAGGRNDVICYLIDECKVNVETLQHNEFGDGPLQMAASSGQLSTVKLLKEKYQADYNRFNKKGLGPIHSAAAGGRNEVICYLVDECKVNVETPLQNEDGDSPLQSAAYYGQSSTVKLLKEKYQADCNRFNKKGQAPIHVAAAWGRNEVICYLVDECKVNVETKQQDAWGWSPLLLAAMNNQIAILKLLSGRYKASHTLSDNRGNNALHYSANNGHTSTVMWLLENNVFTHLPNQDNQLSLELAARNKKIDCLIALYHPSFLMTSFPLLPYLSSINSVDQNKLLRCIFAYDKDPMVLLHTLKSRGYNLSDQYNIDEIMQVADEYRQFLSGTKYNLIEVIAIEKACKELRNVVGVEKNKQNNNLLESVYKCKYIAFSFLLPDYLKTSPKKIMEALLERNPQNSRLSFWKTLNKIKQDELIKAKTQMVFDTNEVAEPARKRQRTSYQQNKK